MIIIDVSPSMSHTAEGEQSALEKSITAANMIIQRKVKLKLFLIIAIVLVIIVHIKTQIWSLGKYCAKLASLRKIA